jgi:C_GCAxxG_C_C family probable redox protein
MSEEMARMTQLHMQGFYCSQIILMLGLELQGKSNPDLIRAMTGLAGGLGFSGKNCGTLTGAVCLLGLYAGRGELEERENHQLNKMIQELVVWFEETFGKDYGGIDCQQIMNSDPWNRITRCPDVVIKTYLKVKELLEENGFLSNS